MEHDEKWQESNLANYLPEHLRERSWAFVQVAASDFAEAYAEHMQTQNIRNCAAKMREDVKHIGELEEEIERLRNIISDPRIKYFEGEL